MDWTLEAMDTMVSGKFRANVIGFFHYIDTSKSTGPSTDQQNLHSKIQQMVVHGCTLQCHKKSQLLQLHSLLSWFLQKEEEEDPVSLIHKLQRSMAMFYSIAKSF